MKSVYMICGIGSSGKSTYANKLYKELKDKDLNKKIIICSVDEQRPRGTNIPIEVARERFVKKVKDNIDFYDA